MKISADQAKEIAEDASADLGYPGTAGTPTLFRWTKNNRHTWVWNVPLTYSTGKVKNGSLYVDAETGTITYERIKIANTQNQIKQIKK